MTTVALMGKNTEKRMIKVLMLMPNLRVSNGVVSFAMNYFRQIDHTDITMDFLLYGNQKSPYIDFIKDNGGKVFYLPSLRHLEEHFRVCEEVLKKGQYDVIHDNLLLKSIPMMLEAKKQRIPVRILHCHNSKLGETIWKEKRNAIIFPVLKRQANAYAACSCVAADSMFGDADYEFIPNIIYADKYKYDATDRDRIRTEMNVHSKKVIITVGRMASQKNPFFAFDVFDIVADRIPNVEYWWIGDGPLDRAGADYVQKLKHSGQVKLMGSRNDVIDLYQAADLFFLPSIFEGLPVTGVEAQAMGLPCVISDTVSRELVYTDLVEFISLCRSKSEWAEIICNRLCKSSIRMSRGDDLLKSRFAAEKCGCFLENYYRRLLSQA